ncbi:BrnT family toxin (plasmid) [Novosphingobium resinovorum]|uniref:BrnT family toxin n=1 Tax=Novosphingobium TaxID=165696 RepID=UPI001B3C52F2|nr:MULTISPECIES: BrnT family toxin [Novosphingobium]MBF7015587.1 BrnT family toxin [Novosphingobium sp. HR1a]WJM30263.1 BrnT family toxin [Novosphingobium resinovorum]
MIIVWDEPKRQANLVEHGIDFADMGAGFFLSVLVIPAMDGRFAAIGEMHGTITVIFAAVGTEGVSLIFARPASITKPSLLP